jgi:hypothetical protein
MQRVGCGYGRKSAEKKRSLNAIYGGVRSLASGRGKRVMGVPSAIAEIFRDFLIFVTVMCAMLIVLFILVFPKMPRNSPLKRLLMVLSYRVVATVAAAPINPTHAEKAV